MGKKKWISNKKKRLFPQFFNYFTYLLHFHTLENINFKNPLLMQSSQYRSKRNKKKKNYAQLEGGSNNFKKGGKLEYFKLFTLTKLNFTNITQF
jgi:hypothetical protein